MPPSLPFPQPSPYSSFDPSEGFSGVHIKSRVARLISFSSFSRGGWAAAAVGLLALLGILLGSRHHRIPALLLLAVVIGGGLCFTKIYLAKTFSYISRVEGTVNR